MTIYDNLIFYWLGRTAPIPAPIRCRTSWPSRLLRHWIGVMALVINCLWGLLPTNALAGALPPLPLQGSIALETHATWLLDPQGTMTAEDVSAPAMAARFAPLQGPLSLGFTRSVVWVRLDLDSVDSAHWVLEVGNPILEDVRLYVRGPDGNWQVRYGTLSEPTDTRELHYRKPVFNVALTAGAHSVFYLRMASRTAMVTDLKLTTPKTFFKESGQSNFIWGLVFGAYFLVIFFYSAFWIWTRERVHLLYVLYVGTNLGAAFLTGRWNDMLGLNIDTQLHTLALGLFIGLSLWIGPVFSLTLLGTHKIWPRSSRFFIRTCVSISIVGMGLVIMGFYSQGVMAVQISSMFMILVILVASGLLAWKGEKNGQLLLLAFSLFYMGVVWRYLRNIGLIEPTWWNENVYQVGAFMHMMVMSIGIFSSYNALRRKSQEEQAKARTQGRLRERQYKFLGMVSHEVRTPLTVISASADNLLLDPSVSAEAKHRVEKIVRHCLNLQHLFTSYLDNERLLNGDQPIKMTEVNLTDACASLVQEINDTHGLNVRFEHDVLPLVTCHADLLRVAISNLLDNARKHTPVGTDIRLEVRRAKNQLSISVTDLGPGIDQEDLPYIFDAYFRGRNTRPSKGSGLGLHLVKFIAEQHKGAVFAVPQKEKGMRFVLEIPLNQGPSGV
jgi:signal transduction histidine kinase